MSMYNPTITTSCGENAARLNLEAEICWKILPGHKKAARRKKKT